MDVHGCALSSMVGNPGNLVISNEEVIPQVELDADLTIEEVKSHDSTHRTTVFSLI